MLPLARAVLSAPDARFQLLRIARKGAQVELTFEETEVSRKLANLERRTRVDDGEGNVVRMSLADVRKQLTSIYERLAELERAANANELRRELDDLENKAKSPAFWDQAFGKGGHRRLRSRKEGFSAVHDRSAGCACRPPSARRRRWRS